MSAAAKSTVEPPFGPPDVEWKKKHDPLPEGVIDCGQSGGQTVYTGRVYHENELLIGTVLDQTCHFSKDGVAHKSSAFEIMRVQVGEPLVWEKVSPSAPVPRNIVKAGKSKDGKVLYVGRLVEDGSTHIGWVDVQKKQLHVAVDDKEKTADEFEILVHKHLDFLVICPPCPPSCRRGSDDDD